MCGGSYGSESRCAGSVPHAQIVTRWMTFLPGPRAHVTTATGTRRAFVRTKSCDPALCPGGGGRCIPSPPPSQAEGSQFE